MLSQHQLINSWFVTSKIFSNKPKEASSMIWADYWSFQIYVISGGGCGSVDKAVAFDTRDSQFESSLICFQLYWICIEKQKIKKRGRQYPILKTTIDYGLKASWCSSSASELHPKKVVESIWVHFDHLEPCPSHPYFGCSG